MDRDPDPQAAASPAADDPVRADEARDAFSELYEAHAGRVYRYLLSRTSSVSDAEELTSRTFTNAFASLGSYRGRGKFESWLMTIAHNLLANWYRDRGRRPQAAPLDEALADYLLTQLAASRACRAAVKMHQALSAEKMESLIAELFACEHPYTCPHGRPVVLELTDRDLERRFKRR